MVLRLGRMAAIAGLALTLAGGTTQGDTKACNFDGDTLNVSFFYPDLTKNIHDAGNFVVPASDIDPRGFKYASINLTSNSIFIQYKSSQRFENALFHGYVFTDLSSKNISSVSIDRSTTVSGLNSSDLTVKDNSISLNLEGVSYYPGRQIQLDVAFSCGPPLLSSLTPGPALKLDGRSVDSRDASSAAAKAD